MTNTDIKEKYNKLINTELYKEFIEHNPDYYLTHMFFVSEKDKVVDEQIGFYSPSADKVVSFDLLQHKASEPEDAMKKSGTIKGFKIDDSSIGFSKVMNLCKDTLTKEYSQHVPTKYICILQSLESVLMWNVTVVTSTLHMVNVRVNASTGEIISHSAKPLMSLAKE